MRKYNEAMSYRAQAVYEIRSKSESIKQIMKLASETAASGKFDFIFEGELTDEEKTVLNELGFGRYQHSGLDPTVSKEMAIDYDMHILLNKYTISF